MDNIVLGAIGAGTLLLFFILNQMNVLKNDSALYDGGNFVGAAILTVYAYQAGSWPFVVLELVWASVSLRDFIRDVFRPT